MLLEILLIVLIIIVLLSPNVLYLTTRRGKMITIKSKNNKKRIIKDESGQVYRMANLHWLKKNELNRDFENMNIGHTYKINVFGLKPYNYIYEYEEI